jgi:hypothetical protein
MPVKPMYTYHLTQTEYEHWDGPILGSMTFPDQAKTDDNRKRAGWRKHQQNKNDTIKSDCLSGMFSEHPTAMCTTNCHNFHTGFVSS